MSRRFNNKKFLKDVLADKYALIIGNEIILDTAVEPTGDVQQYLLQKVNRLTGSRYLSYSDIALDKSERINPIRQLAEAGELDFDSKYVSPDLKALLETKLFTTILTTSTYGFLESLLRRIWGDELRVVNIYDKESVDDFQKASKSCRREKKYNQPTLIYVFGKMDSEDLTKKYIRTDNDAILLIEKWMRMDVESNNELLDFIRSKRLLALGCKYDNWYFRFLWYVLTGNIDSEKFDGTGEVAFDIDDNEASEKMLRQFLDRTNICVLGNTSSFIRSFTALITEAADDEAYRRQINEVRRHGGIFISYSSKDAIAAARLFTLLCEHKYDVWLDNSRLYGGDDYEKAIADAINSSRVFIALLSPSVAQDLENGETDRYYNKEWRIANQFADKKIIPLAINGYDLRKTYHSVFENIVNSHPSGINLMETDGFHKLISSINEKL